MVDRIDLVIIGAGPAGLTSAIYASRAGKKVVIVEKGAPGGKLNNTHMISNYPGLEGKHGYEFSISFVEQAKKFGSELITSEVIEISDLNSRESKIVKLSNGKKLLTKTIIISSGLNAKKLNIPGYEEYFGKGVGTCLVCDGAFYRGKKIAVIGGGNSATEESLFASDFIGEIHIINSFPSFRAEEITLKKLYEKKNVFYYHNTNLESINGKNGKVTSITIKNNENSKENIDVSGVFTYIGWDVSGNFIKDKNMFDSNGYIKIINENNETIYPGVYAAGDITPKAFRQITIATSEGTKAALAAVDYINKL